MHTKTILIGLIVLVLIAGAWFALSAERAAAPGMPEGASMQDAPANPAVPAPMSDTEEDNDSFAATVELTDSGFSPASVTVNRGETVRFVNTSSRGMWVGADEHPTHTEYDGTSTREHCADGRATNGTFDQCQQVPAGSMWDYTFEKSGTFGYHNHVGAGSVGTVVVN
ncbi:MAG: plastocyanin/azurin family copper-binding protein [Patescibacteria group bacterium]